MRLLLRGVPLTTTPNTVVTFKVSLHNGTGSDQTVTLPTSRRFDLQVRDPRGSVVYDAHADHLFLQVLTPLHLKVEEELHLGKATWQLTPDTVPGTYEVAAWVRDVEGREWRERVTFDVTPGREP